MQIVIENVLAHYETFGSGKKIILILHGWDRGLEDWTAVAAELAKNHKVILLDLPGFGGSSKPAAVFDSYLYADFINNFLNKLKLNQVTVIGHSFGGKVSTLVAAKNKQVAKLILVDASGVEKQAITAKFKIAFIKFTKPLLSILPSQIRHSIFAKIASEDYKNAGELKESFKRIVKQGVGKEAKDIKIPTLIVWGDKDTEVPLSAAKTFNNLIPNSKIRIVWGAGHHPHLEKPDKFLEIVEEFLHQGDQ